MLSMAVLRSEDKKVGVYRVKQRMVQVDCKIGILKVETCGSSYRLLTPVIYQLKQLMILVFIRMVFVRAAS